MTTEIFQFAHDVSVENDLYVLNRKTKCLLSGAAFIWNEWEDKLQTTEKALDLLSRRLQSKLPAFNHWLFIGHKNWQPDNQVVRHRKLWSAITSKGTSIPDGKKVSEVMVSSENGIKYFGLIKCESIASPSVASILRSNWETQLIFAEESVAMTSSEFLLSNGWEHIGNAPSDKIIDLICERDILAYLPLGWFDDRESGCAVIAKGKFISSSFPEHEIKP